VRAFEQISYGARKVKSGGAPRGAGTKEQHEQQNTKETVGMHNKHAIAVSGMRVLFLAVQLRRQVQ
jgi:hypothetical protein